ncbi:hypothetical protein ACTFIU_007183 [Dictyostelium citrinum]
MLKEPKNEYQNKSDEIKVKIKENESSFKNKIEDHYFWNSASVMYIYQSNNIKIKKYSYNNTLKIINSASDLFNWENVLEEISLSKKKELKFREIGQHYLVLKMIFEKKNELLTVDSIKEWHQILMRNIIHTAGEYRTEEGFSFQTIFISNLLIKKSMEKLVENYKKLRYSNSNSSPYAIAAWFTHAFYRIHPFSDGNGRMSRLLGNYIMFSYGFPFPIPISNDNGEYLEALILGDTDFDNGRNTSHLAFLYLNSSNLIYRNYLSNISLYNELNN